MNVHKCTTWTSLWRWQPTTSLGDVPENTFFSSAVKVSYALASATPLLSQILDEWELALSFPLSLVRCLFQRGMISSTEVAGEAVLVVLVLGVAGVTEVPLSITRIVLAPRLERGLFFLALIRVYIPWLSFIIILTKGKHLLKNKKN